jgi:hypothetical protein
MIVRRNEAVRGAQCVDGLCLAAYRKRMRTRDVPGLRLGPAINGPSGVLKQKNPEFQRLWVFAGLLRNN